MKKTYIGIAIVLVVLGIWFFVSANKKAEAPVIVNENAETVTPAQTNTETNPGATLDTTVKTNTTVKLPVTKSEVKEFTVSGQNFSFTPSGITVKKGDTVKITFKDVMGGHNLKIDEFNVATNILEAGDQETVQFVADKTGSFQYYCSVGSHRAMGMWGTLTVE